MCGREVDAGPTSRARDLRGCRLRRELPTEVAAPGARHPTRASHRSPSFSEVKRGSCGSRGAIGRRDLPHRRNSCGLRAFRQDTSEGIMSDDTATKTEAIGAQPPGHPLDPSKAPPPLAESAGPTSPGLPDPKPDRTPESGGYDGKPPSTSSSNSKGGYGAG